MKYILEDINPATDFNELVECKWISYENPYQPFLRLFNPILGTGPNARAESLKASTARQIRSHLEAGTTSHWKKVTDPNSGKIAAGAWWKIYPENPFKHADDNFEAYWFPEGGQRDYATAAIRLHDGPRAELAQKSHLYLNIVFTHPDYRRQGIADLLMEWGIKKADEMGVEIWLEATKSGLPLYKKHGFLVEGDYDLCPKKKEEEKDVEWKKMEAEMCPMSMWLMWRPARLNN